MPRDLQPRNRAVRKTRRWLVLVAAASLAATQGQEKKPMDGLAIATFPVRAAAISGESLPFRTILENRGTSPVQIPAQSSQSQFVYTLTQQRAGGRTIVVSVADRNRRRSAHIPPQTPARYETLPPGRSVERIEDLADFVNEGFEPGEYFVTARYDEANIASPKAPVTILPDDVESFSSAVSGNVLASAMAHRRTDGVTILQRESLKDPREGVFYQRQTLPSGGPTAVAISIDVVPAGSGRWCAWLHDRTLTAAVGWGDRTIVTTQPVQLEASKPELLNLGFQIAPGAGLFGVLDRRGNEARFLAYLADKTGLKLHWVASLTSGGAGEVHWNCQSDGSVTVVWQEPASGRLLSREFTAAGQPKDSAPRVRTSSRPAAWSVVPSGPLTISVLGIFGGTFRYARLGAESVADPNPIPELPGVTGWGFIPSANGVKIVAATAAGISQISPGGAWQTLVKTENPQRVNVFTAPDGSLWVEWVQPGYGIRRARLM